MNEMFKYNFIKNCFFVLLACIIVTGCEDEVIEQVTPESGSNVQIDKSATNPKDLLAARQYYSNQALLTRTRTSDNDSLVNFTPFFREDPSWKFYAFGENDSIVVIDVDLTDRICQDYLTVENIAAYKKYKQLKFRQSYSRYVYTRNIRSGQENGFYMTIIPSVNYVRNANKRIRYNTYLRRDTQLDGYVLFHSLEGKLVNGWEYSTGKLTGKILPANNNRKAKRKLNLIACPANYLVELKIKIPATTRWGESGSGWDVDGGSFPDVVITPGGGDIDGGSLPEVDITPDGGWPTDPDPNPNPDITDPDPGDNGGYGGGGGGATSSITPGNFKVKVMTPVFCNKILNKLKVNPKNVTFVFRNDNPTSNAAYENGEISIYNRLLDPNFFTKNDVESIVFHEFVHYKQDVIDNLVIEEVDGEIKRIAYNVCYTEYDIEMYKADFYEMMQYRNIPLAETSRSELQQRYWNEAWNAEVQPYLDAYNNRITYVEYYNINQIRMEIEAYQSQLDEYRYIMSDALRKQSELNLATFINRLNKITNQ